MPFPALSDLLSQSEGSTLEFKRAVDSPERIAKTLSAFANTKGGWLVIGVNDDRTVRGLDSEKDTVQLLESASDFFVQPPVLVKYQAVWHEERLVLLVRIDESEDKPHQAKNHQGEWQTYVRARDKSVPAGREMSKWLETSDEVSKELLGLYAVKKLIMHLQKTEQITARQFAQLVNSSPHRAEKLLQELSRKGVLLQLDKQQPKGYTLRK